MGSGISILMLDRPREAAVAIVNYVNHRNQNVSLLALTVCILLEERAWKVEANDK